MTARALLTAVLVTLGLSGCDGCRSTALAKLTDKQGESIYRDFSAKRTEWEGADIGTTFSLGDGLRTGERSTAMLALSDGSRLSVEQNTTIRFLIDGAGANEQSIDVQSGEAVVFAGSNPMLLRTHVGLAQLAPGTRVVLTRDAEILNLRVDVGEATFRSADGKDQRVGPGEHVVLEVGMAIVRTEQKNQITTAVAPPQPASDAVRATVLQDGVRARERGGEWHALARGEHGLGPGTGLRLPADTEVQLARGAERARLLGAGEYVVGDGDTLVEALRGDVRFSANGKDIEVRVPGGRIVARAADGGSEGAVRIGDTEGALEMQSGLATFRSASGERHEVKPGQDYHWAIAAVENDQPNPAETDVPPPDYFNLEVRAGESFVVHAPEVPVAVSFEITQCKGRGLLESTQPKRRSIGEGHANLLLPAGARGYTLRCLDAKGAPGRIVARGTAHVLADAGTRQLPLRAPTSLVDADGRTYTIYYQNQLPAVRLSWPNPPKSDKYKLEVDGTVMSVTSAEHEFASGSLRDGVHRVTFEAAERRSRTTTVDVRFDNTTATASLTAPVDRSFKVGDTISIEGLALPAWNVSVRGGTIEKVGADRFQGSVVTTAERPDVAVRLSHRRLGTHYYLRRASGSR